MSYDASIIISTYNNSRTLLRTLDVLKREANQEDLKIQVIVADDGSTSKEVSAVMTLASHYNESANYSLKYLWQQDLGFRLAASRNNALRLVEANIIILIDGDCVPDKKFITNHLEVHKDNPKAVAIGSRKFKPHGRLCKDQDVLLSLSTRQEMEKNLIRDSIKSNHPWKSLLGRNFSFSKSPKSIFFDEKMEGWGCEDTAFSIKLYLEGYKFLLNEKSSVTQFDNLSLSNNPYLSLEAKDVASTIGNHLQLMRKHVKNPILFLEIGNMLAKYAVPFEFSGDTYSLSLQKKKEFFDGKKLEKFEDAYQLYQKASQDLCVFYNKNNSIKRHPLLESKPLEIRDSFRKRKK